MSTQATNRDAAVALAEALGNLPLALEQAAAYTEQTGLSLADYLELFNERRAAYVPPASPSADYPDALAVTFEIAFARIREESPAAADLLTLCAFLAPDDVPLEIFKAIGQTELMPDAPDAAATLHAYTLAKVRAGSFLSMHRLIQALARDRLGDNERKIFAEAAATLMRAAFPFDMTDTRTWLPSARLMQHALTAAEYARAFGAEGETAFVLLNNVGMYLLNNAELAEAKAAFEKAAELCEKLLGPSHPKLAISLNNIGATLRDQRNFAEAAEYMKRALAIDEASSGPEHPDVARDLNNIGEVLRARGDYDEARRHYDRALAIFEAIGDPAHANAATVLNNIGILLYSQNDPKHACAYFRRALLIHEEVNGPDHPSVAVDLTNFGLALLKLNDYDAARQNLERALRIFREHLGEKHPSTLYAKGRLEELDKLAASGPRPRKRPKRRRKRDF